MKLKRASDEDVRKRKEASKKYRALFHENLDLVRHCPEGSLVYNLLEQVAHKTHLIDENGTQEENWFDSQMKISGVATDHGAEVTAYVQAKIDKICNENSEIYREKPSSYIPFALEQLSTRIANRDII